MGFLSKVTSGRIEAPYKIFLYGADGVGKTTFAGQAKGVIMPIEDGTGRYDVIRLPQPKSVDDVHAMLSELEKEPHDYKTLTIDTVDAFEALATAAICDETKCATLEAVPYGKGYPALGPYWSALLAACDRLRNDRKMNILLLGHAKVKKFNPPEGESYDRIVPQLSDIGAAKVKQWSEANLYAEEKIVTHKDDKTKRVQGFSTGLRILRCERSAAVDGKNRFSFPREMALSYEAFEQAIKESATGPVAELDNLLTQVNADLSAKIRAWIPMQPNKPAAMRQAIERCQQALASEKENASNVA